MQIIERPTLEFWNDVVTRSSAATFYHTPLWVETLAQSYPEYEAAPRGFVFDDGTRALLPMLCSRHGFLKKKLRYKALGFGSYGGPVHTGTWDAEKSEALFGHFQKKKVSLHIDGNPLWQYELPGYFVRQQADTFALYLNRPLEDIYRGFSEAHRRGIKTAQKKGVSVRRASGRGDYAAYSAMYADTLRRWGDSTIIRFPDAFTLRLLETGADAVTMWLAEVAEKPVAGIIMLYWNSMAHYWRGASLQGYETYHANTLLQWTAMQDARTRGFGLYDFAPSGALQGVEEFKRRFGAEKIVFSRGHLRS